MKIRSLLHFSPLLAVILAACSAAPISLPITPSALNPQGPASDRIASLWWLMLALSAGVFLLVVGLLAAALLRGRRGTARTAPESRGGDTGRRWPLLGGVALSLVLIAVVFGYTMRTLAAVDGLDRNPTETIQVVGSRWWWEVKYPAYHVTTANEIHIPVGEPVLVELDSSDVIHSFWVPELSGKMDLIPTRKNSITLQADKPGVYRGACAEYCGLQHAHMGFLVIAQSRQDFDAWLAAQQQPAAPPAEEQAQKGQQVFLSAGCTFCHTISGLDDKAIDRSIVELGPDLTHLASRQTIAGASLTLNRGNLAGWILDPQHVKPGSLMPNNPIAGPDLQALLSYLESLQ